MTLVRKRVAKSSHRHIRLDGLRLFTIHCWLRLPAHVAVAQAPHLVSAHALLPARMQQQIYICTWGIVGAHCCLDKPSRNWLVKELSKAKVMDYQPSMRTSKYMNGVSPGWKGLCLRLGTNKQQALL